MMDKNEKWMRPRNWKVVAGVATAAALGLGGIGLANSNGETHIPAPITLQERAVAGQPSFPDLDLPVTFTTVDDQNDSPFDDVSADMTADGANGSMDSPSDSPDGSATKTPAAAPRVSDDSADSPDAPARTSPATSVAASYDSPADSPDAPASPPATAPRATYDSPDSPDYSVQDVASADADDGSLDS